MVPGPGWCQQLRHPDSRSPPALPLWWLLVSRDQAQLFCGCPLLSCHFLALCILSEHHQRILETKSPLLLRASARIPGGSSLWVQPAPDPQEFIKRQLPLVLPLVLALGTPLC